MAVSYAIKAAIADAAAKTFAFPAHKTMYDGKHIAVGDEVFIFAREAGDGLLGDLDEEPAMDVHSALGLAGRP